MSDETREQTLEWIRREERFMLVTHEHPDGDALGSLVATQGLLTALGKDSRMLIAAEDLPLPYEYRFFSMEGLVSALPEDLHRRTIVFLDCGNIDRNPAQALRACTHLLNIDHHHDNTCFGRVNHVVPDASCTAEIVWDLMHGLDVQPPLPVAEALYVGLITDTGRFMYENTGASAHVMASELIGAGVDVEEIYRRLYEGMPYAKLALLARALEGTRRFDGGTLTMAHLAAQDFLEAGAQQSYSEGIIDHLRSVQDTKVAALVRDLTAPGRRGQRKVSLRATDDLVDVSAIARARGGGGHRRAAGFTTDLEVDELISFLRAEIASQLRPVAAPALHSVA